MKRGGIVHALDTLDAQLTGLELAERARLRRMSRADLLNENRTLQSLLADAREELAMREAAERPVSP